MTSAGATPLIAIVDDEESIRKALGRLIRSARLDVVTYPSGDEFLEMVLERKPDCVVLDLHMPNADGFRVQAWLAGIGVRIPVIVITGRDMPETRQLVMENGAFAYFRKPVDGDALLEAIDKALGRKTNGQN